MAFVSYLLFVSIQKCNDTSGLVRQLLEMLGIIAILGNLPES